ncbi:hypothetical protein TrCOL_g467 [Triparma columacea]|uniref:Uncharacterized protein n=1 Tax=Triparma columacea TaxID=722753 RepID=A0A9W7LF06_9STRA|nr:hypothetical protein TrCOL_g467 [Triparma columacea]
MKSLTAVLVISIISHTTSLSFLPPKLPNNFKPTTPHRNLPLSSALAFPLAISLFFSTANPLPSLATADCQKDCLKNCSLLAPNDKSGYCESNCNDYCAQPDRNDGLSGSVSSTGGEVGIMGGSLPGSGTVVKGQDKPPEVKLPFLDFNSDKGKKLIGY